MTNLKTTQFWRKLVSGLMAVAFLLQSTGIAGSAPISPGAGRIWPAPGEMVGLSSAVQPSVLKGVKVYADEPFRFDFILDKGSARGGQEGKEARGQSRNASLPSGQLASGENIQPEAEKLIRYFLASLTVPEADLWVNLSPYEKDRIITDEFGMTEMGRDLLAQDYLLKQLTASVIYPEGETGKKFWAEVYKKAFEKYGTTDIPVDTFNKVWIVPEKAVVFEKSQSTETETRDGDVTSPSPSTVPRNVVAYVVDAKLKVMLESDYVAEQNALPSGGHGPLRTVSTSPLPGEAGLNVKATQGSTKSQALAKDVLREVVIPVLEKEVNEGANFAQLRQVYYSLILAAWYKRKVKASILGKVYVDQKKITGVNIDDPQMSQRIWAQYVEAFKKGAYNYIKEEQDQLTGETIPRKYFSGGIMGDMAQALQVTADAAALPQGLLDNAMIVRSSLTPQAPDRAMGPGQPVVLTKQSEMVTPREETILRGLLEAAWPQIRQLFQYNPELFPQFLREILATRSPHMQRLLEDNLEYFAPLLRTESADAVARAMQKAAEAWQGQVADNPEKLKVGIQDLVSQIIKDKTSRDKTITIKSIGPGYEPLEIKEALEGIKAELRQVNKQAEAWTVVVYVYDANIENLKKAEDEISGLGPQYGFTIQLHCRFGDAADRETRATYMFGPDSISDILFYRRVSDGAATHLFQKDQGFQKILLGNLSDVGVAVVNNYKKEQALARDGSVLQSVDLPGRAMGAGKSYAAVLRNLTQEYISEGSWQRQELLRSIGPQVEKIMREILQNENLKIAIMPLGSTLKGYASSESDIEYSICILSDAPEYGVILPKEKEQAIYDAVNKLLPSGEHMLGLVHVFNYTDVSKMNDLPVLFGNDAAYAFLPAAYGDGPLVEQVRKNIFDHIGRDDEAGYWPEVQEVFNDAVAIDPDVVSDKPHLADFLKERRITVAELNALRQLPDREILSREYADKAQMNSDRAMAIPRPAAEFTSDLAMDAKKEFLTFQKILDGTLLFQAIKESYPGGKVQTLELIGRPEDLKQQILQAAASWGSSDVVTLGATVLTRKNERRHVLVVAKAGDLQSSSKVGNILKGEVLKTADFFLFFAEDVDKRQIYFSFVYVNSQFRGRMAEVYRRLKLDLDQEFPGYFLTAVPNHPTAKKFMDYFPSPEGALEGGHDAFDGLRDFIIRKYEHEDFLLMSKVVVRRIPGGPKPVNRAMGADLSSRPEALGRVNITNIIRTLVRNWNVDPTRKKEGRKITSVVQNDMVADKVNPDDFRRVVEMLLMFAREGTPKGGSFNVELDSGDLPGGVPGQPAVRGILLRVISKVSAKQEPLAEDEKNLAGLDPLLKPMGAAWKVAYQFLQGVGLVKTVTVGFQPADRAMAGVIPEDVVSVVQQLQSVGQVEKLFQEAKSLKAWGAALSQEFLSLLETMSLIFGYESGPGLAITGSDGSIFKNWQVPPDGQEAIWEQMYNPENYSPAFEDIADVEFAVYKALSDLPRGNIAVYSRIKQYKSLLEKLRIAISTISGTPIEDVPKDTKGVFDRMMALKDMFRANPKEYFDDLVGFDIVINDAEMGEEQRVSTMTKVLGDLDRLLGQHAGWRVEVVRKEGRAKGYESGNIFVFGLLDHKIFGELPVKIQVRFFNALKQETAMRYIFKKTGKWEYPPWLSEAEVNSCPTLGALRETFFKKFKEFTSHQPVAGTFNILDHISWPSRSPDDMYTYRMPYVLAPAWINTVAAGAPDRAMGEQAKKSLNGEIPRLLGSDKAWQGRKAMLDAIGFRPGNRIVSIGDAGDWRTGLLVAWQGGTYVGFDAEGTSTRIIARENYKEFDVTENGGDARLETGLFSPGYRYSQPISNHSQDFVFSGIVSDTGPSIETKIQTLEEAVRVIKDGGKIPVITPIPENIQDERVVVEDVVAKFLELPQYKGRIKLTPVDVNVDNGDGLIKSVMYRIYQVDFLDKSLLKEPADRAMGVVQTPWGAVDAADVTAVRALYDQIPFDRRFPQPISFDNFLGAIKVRQKVNSRGELRDSIYLGFGGDVVTWSLMVGASLLRVVDLVDYDAYRFKSTWRAVLNNNRAEFEEAARMYLKLKHQVGYVADDMFILNGSIRDWDSFESLGRILFKIRRSAGERDALYSLQLSRECALMIELTSMGVTPDDIAYDPSTGQQNKLFIKKVLPGGKSFDLTIEFLRGTDLEKAGDYKSDLVSVLEEGVDNIFIHAGNLLGYHHEKFLPRFVRALRSGRYLVMDDEEDYLRANGVPAVRESLPRNGFSISDESIAKELKGSDYGHDKLVLKISKPDRAMGKSNILHPLFKDGKLNADGIVLVHALDFFPNDGVLYPNNRVGYEPLLLRNPRTIVEFSFNGVIDLWKDHRVVVLVPFSAASKMKFENFWYTATSYFGPFKIPPGSTIMVRGQSDRIDQRIVRRLEGQGIQVQFFSGNALDAVSQALPAMGFQSMLLRTNTFSNFTTWETADQMDYARQGDELGRQFKAIADKLGIPAAETGDYDVGSVTLYLEKSRDFFITGTEWNLSTNIDGFMRRVRAAYASLKGKRSSLEARKFLAFAEFYVELYKLREKVMPYSLPWIEYISRMNPEYGYPDRTWEEYRPAFIKAVNDVYGFRLDPDSIKTPKEYLDVLGRIAQRVMHRYDLAQSTNFEDLSRGSAPGGIDLASAQKGLEVQNSGAGAAFQFAPRAVQDIKIDGLTPVIIDIEPMTMSVAEFAGISGTN